MGLSCTLFRATSVELNRVSKDPGQLQAFFESIEGPPVAVRKVKLTGIWGLLIRLTPISIWEPIPVDDSSPSSPNPEKLMELEEPEWLGLHDESRRGGGRNHYSHRVTCATSKVRPYRVRCHRRARSRSSSRRGARAATACVEPRRRRRTHRETLAPTETSRACRRRAGRGSRDRLSWRGR
jgi:hypothetical protein